MTSAEAAALRDILLHEEAAVPAVDARRLAEVYVAIHARLSERDLTPSPAPAMPRERGTARPATTSRGKSDRGSGTNAC